jgi:hypothetical protein
MDFIRFGFLNFMKSVYLLIIMLLTACSLNAQAIKKDSSLCKCFTNIPVNYPDIPEEDKLQGTVIVEYEIDSFCIAGNPKIIQNLGLAYDKEALRVTNLVIAFYNKCNLKCKYYLKVERKPVINISFV